MTITLAQGERALEDTQPASESLLERALPLDLPPPSPQLRWCVVVPVRNEEVELPHLLSSLARQVDFAGQPFAPQSFEVILLLNNCTDGTRETAERCKTRWPALRLHLVETQLPPSQAHVGRARQIIFDAAYGRFCALRRPEGLILTTDADTTLAPDWITQTQREIAQGVDGVGGRIEIRASERREFAPALQRLFLLDIGYRRALEEMRHLYAPDVHDPFPRHHQHFGGSLAVTAEAYGRAQGMPLVSSSEDVALYHAVLRSGGRFRHSYRVRAYTSARAVGRASGGLADAIAWWQTRANDRAAVLVESAAQAQRRLQRWGQLHTMKNGCLPLDLLTTPEPPSPQHQEDLHQCLQGLRVRNAALRTLTLAERLAAPLE